MDSVIYIYAFSYSYICFSFFPAMNVPLFVILLLIVESFDISLGLGVSENIVCGSSIPTYVCLPRNYSSMDIPLMDEPNHINIEIHISDVLKINDRDFSITFSLYFNVQWREPRLQIDSSFFQNRYLKCIHKNNINFGLLFCFFREINFTKIFIRIKPFLYI